jgi:hypothetical protein
MGLVLDARPAAVVTAEILDFLESLPDQE